MRVQESLLRSFLTAKCCVVNEQTPIISLHGRKPWECFFWLKFSNSRVEHGNNQSNTQFKLEHSSGSAYLICLKLFEHDCSQFSQVVHVVGQFLAEISCWTIRGE